MLTVRAWLLARTGETALYRHGLGCGSISASQQVQVLAGKYDVKSIK